MTACLVLGNSACTRGGGASGGTLDRCTLIGNSAGWGGGAEEATLNNCTLTGNSAHEVGIWLGLGGGAAFSLLNSTGTRLAGRKPGSWICPGAPPPLEMDFEWDRHSFGWQWGTVRSAWVHAHDTNRYVGSYGMNRWLGDWPHLSDPANSQKQISNESEVAAPALTPVLADCLDGHGEPVKLDRLWQLHWHKDCQPPTRRPGLP